MNTLIDQAMKTALNIRRDLTPLECDRMSTACLKVFHRFHKRLRIRNVTLYIRSQGFSRGRYFRPESITTHAIEGMPWD